MNPDGPLLCRTGGGLAGRLALQHYAWLTLAAIATALVVNEIVAALKAFDIPEDAFGDLIDLPPGWVP